MKIKTINSILLCLTLVVSAVTATSALSYSDSLKTSHKKAGHIEDFISDNTYINDGVLSGIGDPYAISDNGMYYMTCTGDNASFKLYSSSDLINWEYTNLIYNISQDGAWCTGKLWQPQIVKKDGKYYLYFSAANVDGSLRIGVAVSDTVNGVYKDIKKQPLFDFGYATIDPNVFIDDDNKMYMYYSRDCSENVVNGVKTSQIYVVPMDDMATITATEGKLISTPELDWEKLSGKDFQWNEGPDLLKHNGKYYLFFSANFYNSRSYSIGYAVSDSPEGPFVKNEKPVLTSEYEEISGTGNNSFFKSADGKELFTAYHAHLDPQAGMGSRYLAIDRCGFRDDGTFYINGPTKSPQPLPDSNHTILRYDGVITATGMKTLDNRNTQSVVDGEIGIYSWNEKYEWAAEKDGAIQLAFDKESEISSLFIYSSSLDSRKPNTLKIEFDDGSVIDDVSCGKSNGEAAIVQFQAKKVKWIKVSAKDIGNAESFGLSEVMVFSNANGEVK